MGEEKYNMNCWREFKDKSFKYDFSINQKAVIDSGFDLDYKDVAIIKMLTDFASSGNCNATMIDGVIYYEFRWTLIKDQLPMAKIKTRRGALKRLEKLKFYDIIVPHESNKLNGDSWYKFGLNRDKILTTPAGKTVHTPCERKFTPPVNENSHQQEKPFTPPVNENSHNNTYKEYNINNNNIDNNINIPQKENFDFNEKIKEHKLDGEPPFGEEYTAKVLGLKNQDAEKKEKSSAKKEKEDLEQVQAKEFESDWDDLYEDPILQDHISSIKRTQQERLEFSNELWYWFERYCYYMNARNHKWKMPQHVKGAAQVFKQQVGKYGEDLLIEHTNAVMLKGNATIDVRYLLNSKEYKERSRVEVPQLILDAKEVFNELYKKEHYTNYVFGEKDNSHFEQLIEKIKKDQKEISQQDSTDQQALEGLQLFLENIPARAKLALQLKPALVNYNYQTYKTSIKNGEAKNTSNLEAQKRRNIEQAKYAQQLRKNIDLTPFLNAVKK